MDHNARSRAIDTTHTSTNIAGTHASKRRCFFDLPREVRDHIYDLAMSHGQTNWVVNPNQDMPLTTTIAGQEHCAKYLDTILVLPQYITFSKPNLIAIHRQYKAGGDLQELIALLEPSKVDEVTAESLAAPAPANVGARHVCSVKCMKQPAWTRASRQIRSEALSVFYGKHLLVLHEYDLNDTGSDYGSLHGARKPSPPVRWWRCIGDTNLRLVRNLVILYRNLGYSAREDTGLTPFALYFQGSSDRNAVFITQDDVTKSLEEWRVCDDPKLQPEVLEAGLMIQRDGLSVNSLDVIAEFGCKVRR